MAKKRRRQISLQANYNPEFKDLTKEPFVYRHPEEEIVEGMRFVHMQKGVYKAAECFHVSKEKMEEINKKYGDVIFWGYRKGEECEIRYAVSIAGCSLDYDRWWEDEVFANCTEVPKSKEMWEMDEFYPDDFVLSGKPMNFTYERMVREDGMIPRIMIEGYIADMVEEGIYYFPEQKGKRRPRININNFFEDADVATVYRWEYRLTPYVFLKYIAIDKKYFPRLKEIAEMEWGYDYHEFDKKSKGNQENSTMVLKEENSLQDVYEPKGEELISGLGTENVVLSFELPLITKRKFLKYRYAYKVEDTLVLVREDFKQNIKEEFNMRLMTQLNVKKEVLLNSGYKYDAILKIIDCKEEKYREILTAEAYRLYEKMEWSAFYNE